MIATDTQNANIESVRRGFESFGSGNMQALSELIEPNAAWRAAPSGVLAGDCPNRDAIFAMFGQLQQETGGTFSSTPLTMAAGDDKVFVQTKATARRKGKTLESIDVLVFTLANGKVREIRFFSGDHPASADFWS